MKLNFNKAINQTKEKQNILKRRVSKVSWISSFDSSKRKRTIIKPTVKLKNNLVYHREQCKGQKILLVEKNPNDLYEIII